MDKSHLIIQRHTFLTINYLKKQINSQILIKNKIQPQKQIFKSMIFFLMKKYIIKICVLKIKLNLIKKIQTKNKKLLRGLIIIFC